MTIDDLPGEDPALTENGVDPDGTPHDHDTVENTEEGDDDGALG